MGLFGFGTKTKADWDREITRLQSELAQLQSSYEYYKAAVASAKAYMKASKNKNYSYAGTEHKMNSLKAEVAYKKAQIAKAKMEKKNAPK